MKRHKSFFAVLMVLVVAACASVNWFYAGAAEKNRELKIGAWVGEQPTASVIDSFQTLQKRNLDTIMLYMDWSTEFQWVQEHYAASICKNGAIPVITWEAWGMKNRDITTGKKDVYIRKMADDMKEFGEEIWINFMHEANGNWYDWAVGDSTVNTNKTYQEAYRYVVDIFRQEGAQNVKWVFCVNASNSGKNASFLGHYPGDDYVDYVAMDGYNWGTTQWWGSTWQSFDQIFSNCYTALSTVDKPMVIMEMSSAEEGGNKAEWITDTYETLRTKYPRIELVQWFGEKTEIDWSIDSSPESLAAYTAAIQPAAQTMPERPPADDSETAQIQHFYKS